MGNKPKINKKRFIYPDKFQEMLDFANENQKFSLLFLINTGARINEVRNVDPKDLDSERSTIILRITKVRARLGETRPTPRIIPVSTNFFKYLKKELPKRKVLSTNALNIALKRLLKEVSVPNADEISVHNIRKTFGTWMLSLGCDGFKIAQHLGHSPTELSKDYATNDIFNSKDKQIMREILGDLPLKFYPQRQY